MTTLPYFRLNPDHSVERCTPEEFHEQTRHGNRTVKRDEFPGFAVSTTFYGIPMPPSDIDGPPFMLFESLVMGGPEHDRTRRYATWAEAEVGHDELVEDLVWLGHEGYCWEDYAMQLPVMCKGACDRCCRRFVRIERELEGRTCP